MSFNSLTKLLAVASYFFTIPMYQELGAFFDVDNVVRSLRPNVPIGGSLFRRHDLAVMPEDQRGRFVAHVQGERGGVLVMGEVIAAV